MKAVELMELFNLPSGMKFKLEDYEIDMLYERANEYNMSSEEMEELDKIIEDGIYYMNKVVLYNLLNDDTTTIQELAIKYKLTEVAIRNRIDNKMCLGGIPYSYEKDEIPLFHRLNCVRIYRCNELKEKKPAKCWRKYFNDEKLNVSAYSNGMKYKNKYTFVKEDIIIAEVL